MAELGSAYGRIIITSNAGDATRTAQQQFDQSQRSISQSMQRWGDQISGIGTRMMLMTAPLFAIGVKGVSASVRFEEAFAGVRKTVDASEEEFAQLEANINRLATSSDSLVSGMANADIELAKIMELAGQLGVRGVDDLTNFTETIALLGMTTNLSTEQGALALAQFANITQMPIDKIDELGSVIVDLGNNMATTEADIVEMATRLAAAGNVVGMSQAQIMGLAAALSSAGLNPEAGGTAMSRVLYDISAAVDTGGEDLSRFAQLSGMTANDFADQWQTDPMIALQAFIGGLGEANESGENMTQILDDLGFSEVRTRDTLLRMATGFDLLGQAQEISNDAWEENTALTEEAGKRADTTGSAFGRVKNNINDVFKSIGDQLTPALKELADKFVPVLQGISQWIKDNPELVQTIAKVVAVVAAVAAAMVIGGQAIAVFGFLLGALFSPVVLIIAAIAALAAAYFTNFMGIRDFIDNEVRPRLLDFWNFLKGVWEWVQPGIENLKLGLEIAFLYIRDVVAPFVIEAFENIKNGVSAAINWVKDNIIQPFIDWLMSPEGQIVQQVVIDGLLGALETIKNAISNVFNFIRNDIIQPIINWLGSPEGEIFQAAMVLALKTVLEDIKTAVSAVFNFIKDDIIPAVADAFDLIVTAVGNAKDAVGPILDTLKNTFSDAFNFIKDNIIQPVIDAINAIPQALEDVEAFFATKTGSGGLFGSGIGPNFDPVGFVRGDGRDSGGPGAAGLPYLIGPAQQGHEAFIPSDNGTFIPNMDKLIAQSVASAMGGGGGEQFNITIYANDYNGGQRAAQGFEDRLRERRRERGRP